MKIFISHISEDEKLALSLKDWIEKSFLGQVDVFVSSDSEDIVAGDRWLNDIESFFSDTSILIILSNKISITRRWVCFEAGAGWIKKIPIIPICFSHLTKSQLPLPFSIFQAINLNDPKFSEILFSSISTHFKFPSPPNINYEKMNKEMLISIGEYYEDTELGLLDHVESMENGFKELGKILTSITTEMTNMRLETEKLTVIINTEAKHPSQSSTKYLQKQSKKLADKIDQFQLTVSNSNESYIEINKRVDKNLEFILNYSRPVSSDDLNVLLSSLSAIDITIIAATGTKEEMRNLSNIMKGVPRFEKNLGRSLNRASEALDNLCNNIDDNIDVLNKAKIRGEDIINDFNKNHA
ncbi:MAG: TIR domain-containing protein [Bacteroidota bacterium]